MKTETRVNFVVFSLFALAVISAVFLVGQNTSIVLLPTLAFSCFLLISNFRNILITGEEDDENTVTVEATPAIVVGAAAVFYLLDSPLSFLICILVTGIYLPNILKRDWIKLIFNISNDVIACCTVFAVFRLLDLETTDPLGIFLLKILLGAISYVIINYTLLAIVFAAAGIKWREALYDLRNSLVEILPLAVFSGLLGKFYFDFGVPMLFMFIVPLFFGGQLHASYAQMSATQKSAIGTLISTLEAKDKYTAGHVERVAKFAKYIGEELGYGPKRLERLRQAALLHDVGKLIVPSALLNKPGKLTEEEFKIIQRHEFVTIEILRSIDFLSSIAVTAGGDHNKMEGKSTRKLEPFIVSACDAFDAMTSSRSYRKALSMDIAFEELHSKQGKQFHPKVVEALINSIESRGEHYGDGYETDIVHADAPEAGIGSAGIGDLEEDANTESAVASADSTTSATPSQSNDTDTPVK